MAAIHRTNLELAKVIEACILVDALVGVAAAWAILSRHEIPTDTILRVLGSADGRRESDVQMLQKVKARSLD